MTGLRPLGLWPNFGFGLIKLLYYLSVEISCLPFDHLKYGTKFARNDPGISGIIKEFLFLFTNQNRTDV